MGTLLEGASRPGHFDGVLTVVAKLLHLTAPDLAFYGQKDAQQLAVITRMAADLNFPVEIVGVPTVREEDGLALSSRNRYLSAPERSTALALSAALFAARDRLAAEEVLRVRAASVGHAAQRRSAALPPSARTGQPPTRTPSPTPPQAPCTAPPWREPRPARCWRTPPGSTRRSHWTTWLWSTRPISPRSPMPTRARPSSRSPPRSAARGSSTTSVSSSEPDARGNGRPP